MKRGDLVVVALQGDYGKPRPALVIQSDFFAEHPSVVILPVTSHLIDTPLFRIQVEPDEANGLKTLSQIMVDKIVAVSKQKIDAVFGQLTHRQLLEIDRSLALFLGIAG